tara:strand:- start:2082 stop:2327 length:246 start_codon:yes stop_codon:yes gene_type:complete
MANMKAKIQQSGKLKGKAAGQQNLVAKSASLVAGMSLGDLSDVDVTGQTDGVMMIYNGTSGLYEVKTEIQNENLNIIGGTY